jgi:predicted metalloprotease with PDZ domain
MPARIAACLLAFVLVQHAAPSLAQNAAVQPIRYTLSFPAPHTHYVEVAAAVPTAGRPEVELMMAVWTPGSYLVREYERNVEAVSATTANGRMLAVTKSDKNRWKIATGGAPSFSLKYRVYGREMSVRTNWIDAGFALINGAPTFMTLADSVQRPHEVVIMPAAGWKRSMTGLAAMDGEHRYRAADFDMLVDSPIVVGNPAVHEFDVDGKKHYLVDEGEAGVFDGPQAARDLQTLVREHRRMWGALPYDKYVFFNLLTTTTDGVGGLEHKNSVVLMTNRWVTRTRRAYVAWLETASHEFFHAWNVKRLRPVELGPFDYENEVLTKSLWISEGITDYYGALAVHRAGLSSQSDYLASLSANIDELQTTPGRLVQSAEMASFDAWIRYYRPDENSVNVSVSYYTKGAILGFLLDARVRKATRGTRSLDDVMRTAFRQFSGARGFTPEDFRKVAEQVSGASLEAFWKTAVEGTGELDYSEALDTFGLRFGGAAAGRRPYTGMSTRNDAGRLVVAQVRRGTPAYDAGINVDDEILALDEFRVRADRLDNRLDQYKPGDKVSVLVARREQLMRVELTFGSEPARPWQLEVSPAATDQQRQQLAKWLQPS